MSSQTGDASRLLCQGTEIQALRLQETRGGPGEKMQQRVPLEMRCSQSTKGPVKTRQRKLHQNRKSLSSCRVRRPRSQAVHGPKNQQNCRLRTWKERRGTKENVFSKISN